MTTLSNTTEPNVIKNYEEKQDETLDPGFHEPLDTVLPEIEDCSQDTVPAGQTLHWEDSVSLSPDDNASKSPEKTLLPDVITMTKYLCSHHKRMMYMYINQSLKDKSLVKTIGFRFKETWLNNKNCRFTDFSYWKIDRTSFYTDVSLILDLTTPEGVHRNWHGTLIIWCSFSDEKEDNETNDRDYYSRDEPDKSFIYLVYDIIAGCPDRQEYVRLSPFLVPYYRNTAMDEIAEEIWRRYLPEALDDPSKRCAHDLAEKMGLTIKYYPVHKRKNVNSILFFQDTDLEVLDKNRPPKCLPRIVQIEADTIIINTNRIKQEYSAFDIYHECIHHEEHYLFYRLQGLRSNDTSGIRTLEANNEDMDTDTPEGPSEKQEQKSYKNVNKASGSSSKDAIEESRTDKKATICGTSTSASTDNCGNSTDNKPDNCNNNTGKKKKCWRNPVYFMEKQADRGAFGLMMPAASTRRIINQECINATNEILASTGHTFRHDGELLEKVGIRMGSRLGIPHFRIRARMLQLGFMEARGSLNYVDQRLIQPFAFDPEAWKEMTHTFVIDSVTMAKLMWRSKDFLHIMNSGEYIYADGHVVKKDRRYVEWSEERPGYGKMILTDWANSHVDECCLRFVRVYVQKGLGRYEFGRMYYDAEYIARTKFFVDDFLNSQKLNDMDDIEARMLYKQKFPKTFSQAFHYLRNTYGISIEAMSEKMDMDPQTLRRWVETPRQYRNEDFLTSVALALELPDWISRLLFKRASFVLDDDDSRHVALEYILRAQSCDGIPAANQYLEKHGFRPLTLRKQ